MRSIKLPSWIERALGLGPRAVPPHVLTLSETALCYGRLERGDAGPALADCRSVDLGGQAFHDGPLGGPLRDADSFTARLEELLSRLPAPVEQATLVLPDRWLRLVFAEITQLPEAPEARLEALRFKLRRLLPFRIEDLRVEGTEVAPLVGQDEPRRLLISFAVENLVAQLEAVFRSAGVEVGLFANESLCLAATLAGEGLVSGLLVADDGYSLLVSLDGEPVLYRHKSLQDDLPVEVLGSIVGRDLRLTRSFLEEKLPTAGSHSAWIAAEEPQPWMSWVEQGLGVVPQTLTAAELRLAGDLPAGVGVVARAALFGAGLQEVA